MVLQSSYTIFFDARGRWMHAQEERKLKNEVYTVVYFPFFHFLFLGRVFVNIFGHW